MKSSQRYALFDGMKCRHVYLHNLCSSELQYYPWLEKEGFDRRTRELNPQDFEAHCAQVEFRKLLLVITSFDPEEFDYEEDEHALGVPLQRVLRPNPKVCAAHGVACRVTQCSECLEDVYGGCDDLVFPVLSHRTAFALALQAWL